MNRRELLKSAVLTPLADIPEHKRHLLWFRGETGQSGWTNDKATWIRRGEVMIRMDQVTALETVDDNGACCVAIGTPAYGIILHPESYARFKRQWAEFWDVT